MSGSAFVAPLALEIDSRPAAAAATALDQMTAAAGRAEGRVGQIKTAADALVAALTKNTAATEALTTKLLAIETAGTKAGAAVATVSTAAEAAASNVIRLDKATGTAKTNLDAVAASARTATSAWAALGTMGAATAERLEIARKMVSASAVIAPPPVYRVDQAAGWAALSGQGATTAQQLDVARRMSTASALATPGAVANQNVPGLSRAQNANLVNLMQQGADIAVTGAMGMSPFMIALQQGPQVAQSFAGPGALSLSQVFSTAGEKATALAARLGPVGLGLTALTAAAGVGALAFISYRSAQQEVERSIGGVGRATGVTLAQINALADAGSRAAGLSRATARETAAVYVGTGRVGPELLSDAVGATRDFAKFMGVDAAEGATILAGALGDVSKGAGDLSSRYGLLNDAQAESIRRMAEQGDRLGAQRRLLDAVRESVAGLAEPTTGWARVTQGLSDTWDEVGRTVDRAVTGGDLDTRLATARAALADARRDAEGSTAIFRQVVTDPQIAVFSKQVAELEALVARRDGLAEKLQASQRSTEAGAIVRSLVPEGAEIDRLQDRYKRLGQSLADSIANPEAKIDGGIERALTSYDVLGKRLELLTGQYERGGEAAAAALRQADYTRAVTGLNTYARGLAEINRQYDEQIIAAKKATDAGKEAASTDAINAGRTAALTAYRDEAEREVVRSRNLPQSFARTVIGIESSGNPNAKNSLSTAAGLGGFTEGTFLEQFRKAFPARAEGMTESAILSLRSDLETVTTLIDQYGRETARRLEQGGFDASSRNLYLGHFLGPAGALRALQADPSARAADVLGADAARANPTIIGGGRTVGSVLEYAGRKVASNAPEIRNIEDQTAALKAQTTAADLNAAALGRIDKVSELLAQERSRGTDLGRQFVTAQDLIAASSSKLTPELAAQREAILKVATAYGVATQSGAAARLQADLGFEREQLFRSPVEQRIASQLKSARIDPSAPEGIEIADQIRGNQMLADARYTLTDAVTGFASDIRRGASAADAFTNAFGRILDKVTGSAIENLVGAGLKATVGSGGAGGIGGLISGILGGGASSDSGVGLTSDGGWSGGGYTGPGGRYEPAGIVHRGEYVMDAVTTSRLGVSTLDWLRSGSHGYADGGLVGGPLPDGRRIPVSMRAPANGNAASATPAFNLIDQRPAGSPDIEPSVKRRSDGGFDVIVRGVEGRMGQRAASGQGPFKQAAGGAGFRNG